MNFVVLAYKKYSNSPIKIQKYNCLSWIYYLLCIYNFKRIYIYNSGT